MSLVGLLLVSEGSPSERARLADVRIETLDLLTGGAAEDSALSTTLRLAAVRRAIDILDRWCPQLREAEKIAARGALCLATASLDLTGVVGRVGGGPDFACDHVGSWDSFFYGRGWDTVTQQRILDALAIKRDLLSLSAKLERQAAAHDRSNEESHRGATTGETPTESPLAAR